MQDNRLREEKWRIMNKEEEKAKKSSMVRGIASKRRTCWEILNLFSPIAI